MFTKVISASAMLLSISVSATSSMLPHQVPVVYSGIEQSIIKAARIASVPRHILLGICWTESKYKLHLPEKPDGLTPSYGICQVKLETAQFLDRLYHHKTPASVERLRNPFINAFYAAKYLKYQLAQYNNWRHAVAAYNRGSFSENHPNIKYVRRVESAISEHSYQ